MPEDEASPDLSVRATSSRRQTTDDNQCSRSIDRMIAAGPLSHNGRTSSKRSLRCKELRALREFGKTLTDDRRLKSCGSKIRQGGFGEAEEVLETTVSCGRAWLCPTCAYHAARHQFRRLADMLMAWTSGGGAVALLTLTQSHCIEDELGTLWDRLGGGWAAMVRGSGWRADQGSFRLRGYVRVTEVVHHPHSGWNVHFHVFLLLDQPLDHQQLHQLKDRLTARFSRGIKAAGGQASWDGQHLDPIQSGSERRLASYYAKGTNARWKPDGSRTPMAILADLKETGEGLALWKEFGVAVTVAKRKRYSPSQGIANLVPNRP